MTPCPVVRAQKHYSATISVALNKSAVHSTTMTAQMSVMKVFIGTSGRTNPQAERSILIHGNVAKSAVSVVP